MTDPSPIPSAPARPGPTRAQQGTAIVATIGVVLALVGLLLSLRPVSTPTQDCGATLGFLLDGRTNEYVDPSDLPKGVTEAEATSNNERPCRERVADAAKPAFGLLGVGLLVGVTAALLEIVSRGLAWRTRVAERNAAAAAGQVPPPPPLR